MRLQPLEAAHVEYRRYTFRTWWPAAIDGLPGLSTWSMAWPGIL